MTAIDIEGYRRASLDQWERSAGGWGARSGQMRRWTAPVSQWMIEAISPQPGQTVLELAAGPGETGLLAAEMVAPGGRVIVSDFAEPMVDVARGRARELGVGNVDFRTLNAESVDLDAASVDAILCRWGFMLVADPAAALAESRRVLRPGGRLALAAWDDPAANPWASLLGAEVLRRTGAPEPDPKAPGMFSFAPPGRVERLLLDAGFTEPQVQALHLEFDYAGFDEWWAVSLDLARPLADLIAARGAQEADEVRATMRDRLARYEQSDGRLVVPMQPLVAAASA